MVPGIGRDAPAASKNSYVAHCPFILFGPYLLRWPGGALTLERLFGALQHLGSRHGSSCAEISVRSCDSFRYGLSLGDRCTSRLEHGRYIIQLVTIGLIHKGLDLFL